MGGVVPVVNLPGVAPGQLKVTGPLLADIYLGKVTVERPGHHQHQPGREPAGTEHHRGAPLDGSGTTFIWTNYLSRVSEEWKTKVGENSAVNWPTGVGGRQRRRPTT